MIDIYWALAGFIFTGVATYLFGFIVGHGEGRMEGSEIRDWHIRKVLDDTGR